MGSTFIVRRAPMRQLASALLVGVGLAAIAASPATAATFTVDTTVDVVNGGDGLTSLREAFTAASTNAVDDSIELAPGSTYSLTNCGSGALTHTAAQALTIEGHGATIDQTCGDVGVITSTDTTATSVLSILDTTIMGGPNTGIHLDGGAVFADGRLVLDGVTITGIDAGPGGTVVDSTFGPGPAPVMWIVGSEISGNEGTAISGDFLSLTVEDSSITNNLGSGIALVDGTPLSINNTTITNNTGRAASTTGQGHTRMQVYGSTFTGNGGGGISCGACANLSVGDTIIAGNGSAATSGIGGGIAFTYDFEPVPVDPGVHVYESSITDNQALRAGGGISVSTISPAFDPMIEPVMHIEDTEISNNTTVGDDMSGGGIAARTGSLIIERTQLTDNVAGQGGAVPSKGGGLYVAEDFDDGIADGRDMIFNQSTLAGNEAAGSGGGAYVQLDGRIEGTDLSFTNNTSEGPGGGLFLSTTQADIDIASFTGNTGSRGGGMAGSDFGGGGELRLRGATFSANQATEHGGAITADDLKLLQLTNSTISGNSAPEGGGISVGVDPMDDPETLGLRFTTVAGNTAPVGANVVTYEGTLRTEASVIVGGIGGSGCAVGPANLDAVGHSFTDSPACSGAPTDLVSAADPQLAPLADNGGPTQTRLPALTSPLGGLVPLASCAGTTTDQRGLTRPQGSACEPGSVEVAEAPAPGPIMGTPWVDWLVGTTGPDVIVGLGGPDILIGLGGDDLLEGGPGRDLLVGGPGTDTLRGGPGFDLIFANGTDVLDGGLGPDLCWFPGKFWPADC